MSKAMHLPHVHTFKVSGKRYRYVRYGGAGKGIRLTYDPQTEFPLFIAQYHDAIRQLEYIKAHTPAVEPKETFAGLYKAYVASTEFRQLAHNTQDRKRRALMYLVDDHGWKRYAQMNREHVLQLRDDIADRPEAANNRVKDLSALFRWAIATRYAPAKFQNPAAGIPKLKPLNANGYHTWTPEELLQFESHWPVGTMQRLAYALMLFTGARVSDAYRLGPGNQIDGCLQWVQQKTQREVVVPIHPALQDAIDATEHGDQAYLITQYYKPFSSAKSLSNWCTKSYIAAGLPDRCVAHGLRKAGATRLAELGATEHQLMSVFGWSSPAEARRYTEAASRKRMAKAAISLLSCKENE